MQCYKQFKLKINIEGKVATHSWGWWPPIVGDAEVTVLDMGVVVG